MDSKIPVPDIPSSQMTEAELPDLIQRVLRVGWLARGLTYSVSGILALSLVLSFFNRSEEPSQKGALRLVADLPLGSLMLVVLAAGLILFPLWELATVATQRRETLLDYLDHVGKVIGVGFYGLLALSAVQIAFQSGSGGSGSAVNSLSRTALRYPLGQAAVVVAGLVVAVIGLRRARRAWTGKFADSLRIEEADDERRNLVQVLGRVGEVGRGLSFLLLGFFLALAGVQDQGSEAQGLDRLLYSLTGDPAGSAAVAVVAIGFVSYGLFCAVSAPMRRLPNEVSTA